MRIDEILSIAYQINGILEESENKLMEKALKDYKEALKMPRKKKKRAKKEALLLYSIAKHFENYKNNLTF